MIRSWRIGLRARHEADIAVLHAELYDDVPTRSRADPRPWRPIPPHPARSPFAVTGPSDTAAPFSVVHIGSGELAGAALLGGIDTHNRTAHLGVALLPAFRGRGLASDVVHALCAYGFTVLGMRRLQVETTAGNAPMIAAATRAGFTAEGTLRRAAWVCGDFHDVAVLGLLGHEWAPGHDGVGAPGFPSATSQRSL